MLAKWIFILFILALISNNTNILSYFKVSKPVVPLVSIVVLSRNSLMIRKILFLKFRNVVTQLQKLGGGSFHEHFLLYRARMSKQKSNVESLSPKTKHYKSADLRVTHQAPANKWSLFSCMVAVVVRICFCDERTDTLREYNDHLFGRGLVG